MRKRKISPPKKADAKKFRKTPPGRIIVRDSQDSKFFDKKVVKCTLQTFSKYHVVTKEIRDCVYWISQLQIHTHHVMTLLVLNRQGDLRLRGKLTLYGLYNKVMRCLANHLQRKKEKESVDKEIMDTCMEYCTESNLQTDWPDGCLSGWRRNVLDQMAKQSETIHKTHLETNLNIYAIRYMKFLLRTDEKFASIIDLRNKDYDKVFSAICSAFWERVAIVDIVKRRPTTMKKFHIEHSIWKTAQEVVDCMTTLVPESSNLSRKSQIMYKILSRLEPYSIELQDQFQRGEVSMKKFGKSRWTFSLVPQMEWRPKHIIISSTALKFLLLHLAKSHTHIKSIILGLDRIEDDSVWEKNFRAWDSLFKTKNVLKGTGRRNNGTLRFGNSISTDGVSVSAVTEKMKSHRQCCMIRMSDDTSYITGLFWLRYCGLWIMEFLNRPKGISHLPKRTLPDMSRVRAGFLFFYGPYLQYLKRKQQELKKQDDFFSDATLVRDDLKRDIGLQKTENGIFIHNHQMKIVGLDPGKKSAATWVVHDPSKQQKHRQWKGEEASHTTLEDRYESDSLRGGEWRFLSGQKQYTFKMNKRMTEMCPEWRNVPTCKTHSVQRCLASYECQNSLWPQIKNAFFDESLWYSKQRMRKFCKRQSAMEEVVSRITGTRDKQKQRQVVVAYGDGDKNGTLRGTSPMMSSALFNKVRQSARVVVINEHNTSKLCSCCHQAMKQFRNQFRMKHCTNSDCIRNVWDRDINAAINILNLFLELCYTAEGGKGKRLEAFKRKTSCVA
jgi:hypothetical protein